MDNNMTDKNIYDINSYYKTEYDSESEKDDEYTDEYTDEEDITEEDTEYEENLEDINEYSDRIPVPSDEEFAKNIKKYNESYERKIKELQIKEEKYGNSLKRKPKKDIYKEYDEWAGKYADTFKSGFPSIPLLRDRGYEESIEIIKDCLSKQKDVYDLGYFDINVLY